MNLRKRINKGLTLVYLLAIPSFLPIGMGHLMTNVLLQKGLSKEFIERQYREELPKESPYFGRIAEFITRPGRELAYVTTKQYKFPWRGYDRKVFR